MNPGDHAHNVTCDVHGNRRQKHRGGILIYRPDTRVVITAYVICQRVSTATTPCTGLCTSIEVRNVQVLDEGNPVIRIRINVSTITKNTSTSTSESCSLLSIVQDLGYWFT